jgi:hypothetical protein
VHRHHVVYAQECRRAGASLSDERNLLPLAFECHGAHHARQRPLPLHRLPDSVFEFAAEALGAPAAFEYLARRYAGGDPRHDALLA